MTPEWHQLECFKPRSYPAPVESVARDHPVYVDGTKLINGKPFLSYGKTDNSRIEELQKLGFSKDTIRMYTDGAFNKYYECSKGKKCNYGSSLPYKPSYSKIGAMNEVYCDDVKHIIEIKNNEIFFNGALIASAPLCHNNGKKFTSTQRASFCKSVVWGIDPSYQGYITKRVKNSNGQMEDISVPDDLYFRELIAKHPALIEAQTPELQTIMRDEHPERYETQKEAEIITVDLVLPEKLNAYTYEALTGYPEEPKTDIIIDRFIDLAKKYDEFNKENMFDYEEIAIPCKEQEKEEQGIIAKMWSDILQEKTIVQKWTHPHLRCNIIEVCTA